MKKLIAIVSVISWSGFWAFGYLALSADLGDTRQLMVATVVAAAAFLVGMITYLRLARDHA